MSEPIIQCVPNFSEGRRPEVVQAIVGAVSATPGVRLVDWSSDTDHNRMVVTFVGPPAPVAAAAKAAAGAAVRHISLTEHHGVHPRLGAIDVLPFVPIKNITMEECARLATQLGAEIAEDLQLPVFLYEFASTGRRALPDVRRGAFSEITPDYGPSSPHPTAGAVVVGARGPLIAYNVNLSTPDIRAAKTIARELRADGAAGFVGVRALGLALESRGLSQVSINVVHPESVSLYALFSYIARRAEELGTKAVESEVIGALPGFSAYGLIRDAIAATRIKPGQVLWENWPT
ncbi:glutamate formiminotransferase [Capsulimonas corticalis]|uniref:glutamate formimidoyltransferase n=1 Tax=Capsulimonas corticalis TaxID=2219043 RepID=A0A402CXS2_9BACT|nr:glutamate formimidoyltransferase [Capsulimonas corticalis]BDI32204.1 glutamate formiminotransferase [Capsulimonas corticalis]